MMASAETGWTPEYPSLAYGSWFWLRHAPDATPELHQLTGGRSWMASFGIVRDTTEFLGPVTVSDAEQLVELRREALKGICVYCGEIQQYGSLEQKSSEEGNQIRVAHIRQCPQRPELKLIAYCEELQEAANAAFKCLCGTGDKTIEQVKDQIYKVLNPKQPEKETQ